MFNSNSHSFLLQIFSIDNNNNFSRYHDGKLGVTDSLTQINDALRLIDSTTARQSQTNNNDFTNSCDPNFTNLNSFSSGMNQEQSYEHQDNHMVSSDIHSSEHTSPSSAVYPAVIKEECKSPTAFE